MAVDVQSQGGEEGLGLWFAAVTVAAKGNADIWSVEVEDCLKVGADSSYDFGKIHNMGHFQISLRSAFLASVMVSLEDLTAPAEIRPVIFH